MQSPDTPLNFVALGWTLPTHFVILRVVWCAVALNLHLTCWHSWSDAPLPLNCEGKPVVPQKFTFLFLLPPNWWRVYCRVRWLVAPPVLCLVVVVVVLVGISHLTVVPDAFVCLSTQPCWPPSVVIFVVTCLGFVVCPILAVLPP